MQTEPAFTETELARRWNVSIKALQRWRSEGIGPPAWHISKSVRYLLMEVEAFEQMMQKRPGWRDQIFYSAKEVAGITVLPAHWLHQNQERHRLGIPYLQDGER